MLSRPIIFLLFIFCTIISSFAQDNEEVLLQQIVLSESAKSVSNAFLNDNRIIINQFGEGNVVSISQIDQQGNSGGNEAYIYQNSLNNLVSLSQTGFNNSTNIEQYGSGNSIAFDIEGSNNKSSLMQSGSNNELISQIMSTGMLYEVQQIGMNNQLIQKEEGAAKLNYKITQTGIGMKIQITNGSIK